MRRTAIAATALILVGCGGGGGSTLGNGSSGGGAMHQFGPIETRGQVNGPPVVRDLRTISTVAMAGEITEATYRPQGAPDSEWPIVIAQDKYLDMSFEGEEPFTSWQPTYGGEALTPYYPDWSADGQRLYFMAQGGLYYIATTAPETTVRLVSGDIGSFAVSPDGSRIIYAKVPPTGGGYDLYRVSSGGTSETRLTTTAFSERVFEFVDASTFIAYINSGNAARYDMSGNPVAGYVYGSLAPRGRTWDGRYLMNDKPLYTSAYSSITQTSNGSFYPFDFLENNGDTVFQACGSPDGKRWVILSYYGAYTTEILPKSLQPVAYNPGLYLLGASWQPALGVTKFVGSSGRLGSTSAGIVATYRTGSGRNGLASFVNWDAQTRSTSTVSDDNTDIDAGAKTYTIEADRLTALRFGNRPFYTNISTVNSGGTTNGAIVSVDSRSGVVTSVVLYVETRGAKPSVRREGAGKVIEGTLVGVWNAKGKNLAPNGTNRVVLSADGSPAVG